MSRRRPAKLWRLSNTLPASRKESPAALCGQRMALLRSFYILLKSVVGQTIAFRRLSRSGDLERREDTWFLRLLLIAWIAAASLAAATLEIHSEFLRVDPQGEILTVDRTPNPREIISPAVVRNGFASFHIVALSPRPTSYFLLAGTNPPDVFRM